MNIEKITGTTKDLAAETAKKLLELLPECAGEGNTVDLDKLRQALSSQSVEGNIERYEFTWPGKRAARAAANARTDKTLRPVREDSVNFDTTGNLYIEGDNLEVLKLLQSAYCGRIKMIYIDPPYNTGNDFVYRDRFSMTQEEIDELDGSRGEEGEVFSTGGGGIPREERSIVSAVSLQLVLDDVPAPQTRPQSSAR